MTFCFVTARRVAASFSRFSSALGPVVVLSGTALVLLSSFSQKAHAEQPTSVLTLTTAPMAAPSTAARTSARTAPSPGVNSKQKGNADESYQLNEEGVELVFKGEREAGVKKIAKALELDPENTTALYNLAGIELANSNPERAISLMEKAVELAPNDLAFWNRLAESHFANNGIEKSIVYYEKITSIDPSYGEVMVRLGTLYGMTKNWEKAEATLRQAVELHSKDARAFGNLGNVLIVQRKFPEAIQMLKNAQQLEESSQHSVGLAIAHEALGKRDDALTYYEQAKKLGDNDPNLELHIQELKKEIQKVLTDDKLGGVSKPSESSPDSSVAADLSE